MNQKDIENQKELEEFMAAGKMFSEKMGSIVSNMINGLEVKNPEEAKKAREYANKMNLKDRIMEANKGLKDLAEHINNLNGADSNKG